MPTLRFAFLRGARIPALLAILLAVPQRARADLPSPRLDRILPLGCSAGVTVEIEIQGADLEGADTLLFDHSGFTAKHLKDRRFSVSVAADVPIGTHDVYAIGRWGVSNPRLFEVARGAKEVAAKSGNGTPETAQTVEIGSMVNGTAPGNSEAVFRFAAGKGRRIKIDCRAQRLDSELDGTLTLTDATGRVLASNGDWFGVDPFLDFVAPADGDYFVSLHDLSFRGGYPYRLEISSRPHIECVFPPVVQSGVATRLTAFGRNLGGAGAGADKPDAPGADPPLEQFGFSVTAPSDLPASGAYRFADHPNHHSVLPTAATFTLTGFQAVPEGMEAPFNSQPLLVVDGPVTVETEPNDDPAKPQPIVLPAVVAGRFDRPRDRDWYEFAAPQTGPYTFEVYSERIAGRADPFLVVVDDQDKRMGEFDDGGPRVNGFDALVRDPSGQLNLTKGKKYRVLVQERYGRGGPRFRYVLVVRAAVPDFFVAAIHKSVQSPAGNTVWKGSATYLDIIIQRVGGFAGPIIVTAEGLPPGVHAGPTTITDSRGVFVVWADRDAADWTGTIRLIAEGRQTGRAGDAGGPAPVIRREVRPHTRVWNIANPSTCRPMRSLVLSVRNEAPFSIGFATEGVTVEAGAKAELKIRVTRRGPEFTEKLTLQPLGFPGRFAAGNVDVPPGAAEALLSLQIPPDTPPGDYTLALLGQGQVLFAKESKPGEKPARTLVALPSRPVTLTVTAKASKTVAR